MSWIEENISKFNSLVGKSISTYMGIEMSFDEPEKPNLPIFSLAQIPCLQLLTFNIILDNSDIFQLGMYQNDDVFGICVDNHITESQLEFDNSDPYSIFRKRELVELPTGVINDVRILLSKIGDINEIRITIENSEIILVAGEFREVNDTSFYCAKDDESILVFKSPEEFNTFEFDTHFTVNKNGSYLKK